MSDPKSANGYDDVENGPMPDANREVRDIFCCLLFIANIVSMAYCTYFAYKDGNPYNAFRAIDGNNHKCDGDYPYLYFYNPTNFPSLKQRACVDECPMMQGDNIKQVKSYNPSNFAYTVQVNNEGQYTTSPNDKSIIGYDSTLFLQRICLPKPELLAKLFKGFSNTFSSVLDQGDLGNLITDVTNNWQWLLAAFGMAIAITLIWMFSLRILVYCIVWISILGIILFFVGLGIMFLYNARQGVFGEYNTQLSQLKIIPILSNSQNFKYYGYAAFAVAGLLLLITFCCCGRIRIAVAICQVASEFVLEVCRIIFVPIFQTFLIIGLWAACLVAMVYLVSTADFVSKEGDIFQSIGDYTHKNLIRLYYFIFGTLWCNAFLQAISIFVVASTCCMWYYSHGVGGQFGNSPILRSYLMVIKYHLGSLAFGSLILAIVQFIQLLLQIFKKNAQSSGVSDNPCFECVLNFLRCFLACIQRIVQFINKTAYIQIALRGKNFCMAAKDGFQMVWGNGMRYIIVSGIGQIIMFIGKILIAVATTGCFYCLITFVPSIKQGILQPLYLLLIVFIVSFAVAMVFMSVYSLAMDTLLACFIVDETNQKAKGGKAIHAPDKLAELMDQ